MSYLKTFVTIAIAFVIVGCASVQDTILHKKSSVVLIVNEKMGAIGSGFFIGKNEIITNAHVVQGGEGLKIKTEKGVEFFDVEIVKSDKFSDIAEIKIKDWDKFDKTNNYSIVEFTDHYRQLDEVYTIGHPWSLVWSISKGVISSTIRLAPAPKFLLQTDAHVFQGNSGGPLFNTEGEVVGINSNMIANEGGSYGMAIPSKLVVKALNDLEEYNEVRWAVIGVKLEENVVKEIVANDPADKATIKVGDKVLSVQTTKGTFIVSNADELISLMAVTDYKDPIYITVDRNGHEIVLEVHPTYKSSSVFQSQLEAEKPKTN